MASSVSLVLVRRQPWVISSILPTRIAANKDIPVRVQIPAGVSTSSKINPTETEADVEGELADFVQWNRGVHDWRLPCRPCQPHCRIWWSSGEQTFYLLRNVTYIPRTALRDGKCSSSRCGAGGCRTSGGRSSRGRQARSSCQYCR